jgi:hypothetical protein
MRLSKLMAQAEASGEPIDMEIQQMTMNQVQDELDSLPFSS